MATSLLVGTDRARQMNRRPMTKDWCFINIQSLAE